MRLLNCGLMLLCCSMTLLAQVRPPAPRPAPERGYGTATERARSASTNREAEERRDAGEQRDTAAGSDAKAEPFKRVSEERAENFLVALAKRLKSVRTQSVDFIAVENGPAGVQWQARCRYESSRDTAGVLCERLHIAPQVPGAKPTEERLLFVTTPTGLCTGWRYATDTGAVKLGENPLAIALRGRVLLLDLLPLDPVHFTLLHAGERTERGVPIALLRATPRHGRKGDVDFVLNRTDAGLLRGEENGVAATRLQFNDTLENCDGFRVPTARKFTWGEKNTSLLLQFSGRRVNTPVDRARFTPEGLAH